MDNQLINLGVTENNKKIVVSSRDIALVFEKEHDKILSDVVSLNCSSEFSTANFGESEYVNDRGRTNKEHLLTRDGFGRLSSTSRPMPAYGDRVRAPKR